jgi:ABC-type antimicrobial peptide transport system permease subunit
MSRLALDLRTAFRALVRGRFASALAILAFALGIGVTTAVFTVFNAVILRPLPYPDSDRVVVVYGTQPSCPTCPASYPEYQDWKTRNQVFSAIGGSTPTDFVMTGRGDATRVVGMATTASLADVYRVAPAIGRWYTGQEDQFGGPKLVVLSHPFWTKYFNADPAVVGRTVVFDLGLSGPRYTSDEQVVALYREVYSRLSQVNTIETVGLISHLPMYWFGFNGTFEIEGGNPWPDSKAPLVEYRWFHGQYFKTLGIPLLKGRLLDERDGRGTTTVVINRAMAEKFWPGKDPIGKRFGQGGDGGMWFEVVGVIGDVRSFGLSAKAPYEFYRTLEQSAFPSMTVVIRTRSGDPGSIIPTARGIVAAIDPSLPMTKIQTLDEVVSTSVGRPRLMSALTSLFAGLAGVLAMVGVYGVMAYNVRRQRREFGIRLALGASRATLGRLVVRRTLALAGIGICAGAFGAWGMSRVLRTMLNDVQPDDPFVFATTAAAMLAVALLASLIPARAAGRVDPIVVLRDN